MAYSPILGTPKPQFEDANGVPYVGMRLFFYVADSSTKLDTQTDSTGTVANTNPVVIGADGYPEGDVMIYGQNGNQYKIVAALPGSDDPPTSPLWTINKILCGVSQDEWINPLDAIYVSATQFTVAGDQTGLFHANRPIKLTGGADRYGFVDSSVYTSLTTVTVKELTDSSGTVATLHASMDTAYVSLLSANSTSAAVRFYPIESDETSPIDLRYPKGDARRYGVDTNSADNTAALNIAFAQTGIRVKLPKGTINYLSNLDAPTCDAITGEGNWGETVLKPGVGVTKALGIGGGSHYPVLLKDFKIDGSLTTDAIGLKLGDAGSWSGELDSVWIEGFTGTSARGVDVKTALKSTFNRCVFQGNYINFSTENATGSYPTTFIFRQCFIRTATTVGAYIVAGYSLVFDGVVFESNTNEGLLVNDASATYDAIEIQITGGCWFENNWGSTTTEYQFVAKAGGGRTCRVNMDHTYFGGSGATAKAINLDAAQGFVLNNVQVPNVASTILVQNNAYGSLNVPPNLVFSTIVSDTLGLAYDTNKHLTDIESAWTSWVPVYTSNIGDTATTFTATPTTTRARYKIVGNLLFISVKWDGTLQAVTPAYILISLPSIAADTTNQYVAGLTINTAAEAGFLRSGDNTGAWNGQVLQYRNAFAAYSSGVAVGGYFNGVFELA